MPQEEREHEDRSYTLEQLAALVEQELIVHPIGQCQYKTDGR